MCLMKLDGGGNQRQAIASLEKLVDLNDNMLCEGHLGVYQPADEWSDT